MSKTVVIIDDDLDDLETISYVFKMSDPNICCISFNSPVEAIKKLSKEDSVVPDYVLIDINMPVMSGPECLLELRRLKRFDDVLIVMLSTSMPEAVAGSLAKIGASFTFQKPFDVNGYYQILKDLALIKII